MNLSIVVVPAKVLKDGTHKIRIAISHNCETRYKVTRFVVPSIKNIKNGRVIGKDISNAEYINTQLNGMVQKMYRAFDTIDNADCYTCSQLLTLIESKISVSVPATFEQISEEWIDYISKKAKPGTIIIRKRAFRKFLSFVGEGFIFSMLSRKIVNEYYDYLRSVDANSCLNTPINKKLSNVTINIYMDSLRQIKLFAERRKFVSYDVDPFIDVVRLTENVRDVFIPVSTLRAIRDYNTANECEKIAQDIFMLSFYLCGMNLADMLRVDFSGDFVSFTRKKTESTRSDNKDTQFTIQPEARAIINKYITNDGKLIFGKKRSLHVLHNYTQMYLKKIVDNIGYDRRVVFYSARKTFAQLCYVNHVQEMVIRYCIGDAPTTREKDMLVFYTRTEKRMADEAIRRVFDFVAGDLSEDDVIQGRK